MHINVSGFDYVPAYQIILGTIEGADTADVEWVFRPYMNTTKKRKFLST